MKPRRSSPHPVAVLALALAAITPSIAFAEEAPSPKWEFSAVTSPGSPYTYRQDRYSFGSYESRLSSSASVSIAATRRVSRHVSLIVGSGYHGYQHALGLVGIPEVPPTTGRLRADIVSVGAGLRFDPWPGGRQGIRPYAQIVPAVFFSRWQETTVDHEGYDMQSGVWRQRSTYADSFRSVLPGFVAGAGVRAWASSALGLDVGLRLTRAADLGTHTLGRFSSGDFLGLDQTELVAGLAWSP